MRAKKGEVSPLVEDEDFAEAAELCSKAIRWAGDHHDQLAGAKVNLSPWLYNRRGDNWRPLFAIAHLIGWTARLADAAEKIEKAGANDDETIGVMLLADIQAVFETKSVDRISSADLATALRDIEGRPWAEYGRQRKAISTNQVARRLKDYGIAPGTIRLPDGTTAKGYYLSNFTEVFERFLIDENTPSSPDPGSQTVTPSQPAETLGFSENPTVTTDPFVTVGKSLKPAPAVTCDGVTVWDGGSGDAHAIEADSEPTAPAPDDDDTERSAIVSETDSANASLPPKVAWDI